MMNKDDFPVAGGSQQGPVGHKELSAASVILQTAPKQY